MRFASMRRQVLLAAAMIGAMVSTVNATAWAARCDEAKDPITISETQQMNYGTIAVTNGGGTVTMAPGGSVTAPGGFTVTGVTTAGQFRVTGKSGCSVTISFGAGFLTGPGTAMQINNFTTNAGTNPTLNQVSGNQGRLDFNVGGDLVVNPNQVGGSYSGTYTVTVIY